MEECTRRVSFITFERRGSLEREARARGEGLGPRAESCSS